MSEEEIQMDCEKTEKKEFSRGFRILLYFAIANTGFAGLSAIYYIPWALRNHGWEMDGMTYFCWNCMFYVIMLFCFIILEKIAVSKRPFSGALVTLFYGVGLLFITGSAIFPSLPGYTRPHMLSGVEGGFYIDMIPFMAGLVLVLFGRILRYGFEYQKEMDSIL